MRRRGSFILMLVPPVLIAFGTGIYFYVTIECRKMFERGQEERPT